MASPPFPAPPAAPAWVPDACLSLLVVASAVALAAASRRLLAGVPAPARAPAPRLVLEASGAFQVCACTRELSLLAALPPRPQAALALTFLSTALHGRTLPAGSLHNPASSLQLLLRGRLSPGAWALHAAAQLLGGLAARLFTRGLWALGASGAHARAEQGCQSPLQTSLAHAFALELLFSFLLHLTLLQLQGLSARAKSPLVALLVTALVYEGGHLTGAIFNPALAFSMHLSCFSEKFWNYILVYWIAPCLGSVLVVIAWDEILPLLHREP